MSKNTPRGKIVDVVSYHVRNDIGYVSVRYENGAIKNTKKQHLTDLIPSFEEILRENRQVKE